MKKNILKSALAFFLTALTLTGYSQAPQKMSYQAVIRNNSNALVTSSPVGMKISILQGTATGTLVYAETQTITTNVNGLASLEVGAGAVVGGTFTAINWANGPYFIKTEVDPNGGTSYNITGTSQLLSVPYALYAENSGKSIGFSAFASTTQTVSASTMINFNSELYDDGNNFSANQFVAPSAGLYSFDAHVRFNAASAEGQYIWLGIYVNGNLIKANTGQTNDDIFGVSVSSNFKLNAGDVVEVGMYYASTLTTVTGVMNTWFNGVKVH